jgi:hypothetical protein
LNKKVELQLADNEKDKISMDRLLQLFSAILNAGPPRASIPSR